MRNANAREEFGGWRSIKQKGGGGWDLDASARKSNKKNHLYLEERMWEISCTAFLRI